MNLKNITYAGHAAIEISNGTVKLIVLTDVGPRVIFYGYQNGPNEFQDFPEQLAAKAKKWVSYGGTRLWVAPENQRTYFPDNVPVEVTRRGSVVRLTSPEERKPYPTHLQKSIDIQLAPSGTEVTLTYKIKNLGPATEMAPWTISVMRRGGHSILPLPERAPWGPKNYLPNGQVILWSYTDFTDARLKLGRQYIELRQQNRPRGQFTQQKIGVRTPFGWGAYYNAGHLFLKRTRHDATARYPDLGCNFETYTEPGFLELETLGPVRTLARGATAEHVEQWWLFNNVPAGRGDAWINRVVLPRVRKTE